MTMMLEGVVQAVGGGSRQDRYESLCICLCVCPWGDVQYVKDDQHGHFHPTILDGNEVGASCTS